MAIQTYYLTIKIPVMYLKISVSDCVVHLLYFAGNMNCNKKLNQLKFINKKINLKVMI